MPDQPYVQGQPVYINPLAGTQQSTLAPDRSKYRPIAPRTVEPEPLRESGLRIYGEECLGLSCAAGAVRIDDELPAPQAVHSVPEPSVALLLALGAAAWRLRR